eukprot:gene29396-36445_t
MWAYLYVAKWVGLVPLGGAGYGVNNKAMYTLSKTNLPVCTPEMDLDTSSEDTYVGFKLYRDLGLEIIQCGGFRPTHWNTETTLDTAITYHHINEAWLQARNMTELK